MMTKALRGVFLSSACCELTVIRISGMGPTTGTRFHESLSVGTQEMLPRNFDHGYPEDIDLRQKAPPEATDFQLREGKRYPLSVCVRACVQFWNSSGFFLIGAS